MKKNIGNKANERYKRDVTLKKIWNRKKEVMYRQLSIDSFLKTLPTRASIRKTSVRCRRKGKRAKVNITKSIKNWITHWSAHTNLGSSADRVQLRTVGEGHSQYGQQLVRFPYKHTRWKQ